MIRKMEKGDSKECAYLHYDSIKGSFLCEFGPFFLQKLYEGLAKSKNCTGYVYISNLEVVGFITGSRNMDGFMKGLILKKFLVLIPPVVSRLLNKPYLIRNVLETFLYSTKSDIDNVKAELVSIVVKKGYRGEGIGRKLFNELVSSFREQDISSFKVMVDKGNVSANKFYEALGFGLGPIFNMYGKSINLYTYSIR